MLHVAHRASARTSVLPQAKPWRRRNSLPPSMPNPAGVPAKNKVFVGRSCSPVRLVTLSSKRIIVKSPFAIGRRGFFCISPYSKPPSDEGGGFCNAKAGGRDTPHPAGTVLPADAHDAPYHAATVSCLRRPPFFPPAERKVGKKRRKEPMVPRPPVAVPEKIVGLTLILDFFDRGHSLTSLHPPPAALGSLPLRGRRTLGRARFSHAKWSFHLSAANGGIAPASNPLGRLPLRR